jgi:hydroxymethylpyrimidine/phosphomethylpyrimidine kinase
MTACDRCLALSELTLRLCKVPVLRTAASRDALRRLALIGDVDAEKLLERPIPTPLAEIADGLAPLPRELLRAVVGVSPDRFSKLESGLAGWSADAVRARTVEAGLTAVCSCSTNFPECVTRLSDVPPVLYIRGSVAALEACPDNAIAMVGTRRPTMVGRDAARRISAGIARSGGTVVSGMALGVDAASHEGALSVAGRTIAVLASGADRASPPSNRRLYDQILEQGATVSELPPGTAPAKWTFPARNRIIAALSIVTVVVEAPLRSGALITVEQAQDLGRDVYAVPGSLASDVSEGTNRMLCDGAQAVVDGAALAVQLGMRQVEGLIGPQDGALGDVHAALARGPLSIDEIVRRATSLGPGEVELARCGSLGGVTVKRRHTMDAPGWLPPWTSPVSGHGLAAPSIARARWQPPWPEPGANAASVGSRPMPDREHRPTAQTPVALTIAGSDSGGGAGIQADLKAFAAAGVHGTSAITALTAQNTVGVSRIEAISPAMIVAQVEAVASDLEVGAVKIGMLATIDTIEAVSQALDLLPGVPVVHDPVMISESGSRLLQEEALAALVELIIPRVTVVTPNLSEARALAAAGGPRRDETFASGAELDGEELLSALLALGPAWAMVTGGHRTEAIDLLAAGATGERHQFAGPRHPDGAAHGSGCTHSSTLAAHLARGASVPDAAAAARVAASDAVLHGLRDIGAGAGPVDVLDIAGRR